MLRTFVAGLALVALTAPALAQSAGTPTVPAEAKAVATRSTPAPTPPQTGTPLPPSLTGFSETYSGSGCMRSRISPTS